MTNNTDSKQTMSVVAHLIALRNIILSCALAVLVIFLVLLPFANDIYSIIAIPIISVLPKNSNIIAIGVISPFLTPLKMSLILAVYIAMPYLLYKIWSFVAPALYKNEKKLILPLVISSTILFYCGLLFSYFVVFPVVFNFLANVGPSIVAITPDIQYYLDFVLKLSFAFGVAFEVPVATILLLSTGAVSVATLRKNRPYFIILAFVIGMILTPPDIISQTLIALPMWLLFEFGLLYYTIFYNKKKAVESQDSELEDYDMDKAMDEIESEFKNLD